MHEQRSSDAHRPRPATAAWTDAIAIAYTCGMTSPAYRMGQQYALTKVGVAIPGESENVLLRYFQRLTGSARRAAQAQQRALSRTLTDAPPLAHEMLWGAPPFAPAPSSYVNLSPEARKELHQVMQRMRDASHQLDALPDELEQMRLMNNIARLATGTGVGGAALGAAGTYAATRPQ